MLGNFLIYSSVNLVILLFMTATIDDRDKFFKKVEDIKNGITLFHIFLIPLIPGLIIVLFMSTTIGSTIIFFEWIGRKLSKLSDKQIIKFK